MSDTETCKHCGLQILTVVADPGRRRNTWVHADGEQRGKGTCALDPYGFIAGPVGDPCPHTCNAYRDYCGDCGVELTWETRHQFIVSASKPLVYLCPEHYAARSVGEENSQP